MIFKVWNILNMLYKTPIVGKKKCFYFNRITWASAFVSSFQKLLQISKYQQHTVI